MITAEEFFRNKIKEKNPNIEVVTLSRELITAEEGMRWAHEFKQLHLHDVVVELPKVNSKDFKDWLKSEGYKNKGFGIYQKENKDYCYKLLYKHYCNILEFDN